MLTVHHLAVSQSDRVVWLLEELEVPYKLVWHRRTEEGLAPPSFLALHPAATAPVIEDGDLVLSESEAILPYICYRHAGGRLTIAPSEPNYPEYLYWLALNNNLLGVFFAKMVDSEASSMLMGALKRREEGYLAFLEMTLATRPFLAGEELTCSDIMSLFLLRNPKLCDGRDAPNTLAWIKRLTERPAYAKADAIAGPRAVPPENA